MTRLLLLSLSLVLFFTSCVRKAPTMIDFKIFEYNQIKKIERISFDNSDYIDSCKFVLLETSDQSLIGEISQLKIFEGNYYIYDKLTKKVKVFNKAGKFLHDIGSFGNGKGEYTAISTFFVNQKDLKVCLFDPLKKSVHEYTLEGKYLQSIEHNFSEYSFFQNIIYGNNELFCYSNINWNTDNAYTVISSNDYSLKEGFCPYPVRPNQQLGFIAMDNPFGSFDGKLHYVSLFSDTIYTHINGKETPYILVETGKPNIPPTYLKSQNLENDPVRACFQIWKDDNYSSGFTELGETERFVLVGSKLGEYDGYGGSNRVFYLLDKEKNEGLYVKNANTPNLGLPTLVDGNRLIKVWQPNEIDIYKSQIKNGAIKCPNQIISLLEEYDPDFHNPVIVVYYMKE